MKFVDWLPMFTNPDAAESDLEPLRFAENRKYGKTITIRMCSYGN